MFCYRARAILAAGVGIASLTACDPPTQKTDLRSEGPPEVLAVLVATAPGVLGGEDVTFCKQNDAKVPVLVGLATHENKALCPDPDLTEPVTVSPNMNGAPAGWYIRIAFDELLDPSIERLEVIDPVLNIKKGHIDQSLPVILTCEDASKKQVPIAYDGYYVPNGNGVSWPVGPSLVIQPILATGQTMRVPTGTQCEITLKADVIKDKSGETLPADQVGPFKFGIAPLDFKFDPGPADPGAALPVIASDDVIRLVFTSPIKNPAAPTDIKATVTGPTDVDPNPEFTIDRAAEPACGNPIPNQLWMDGNLSPSTQGAEKPDVTYKFTIDTGSTFKDLLDGTGTTAAPKVIEFQTEPFALIGTTPGINAQNHNATAALALSFNTDMDPAAAAIDTTKIKVIQGTTEIAYTPRRNPANPAQYQLRPPLGNIPDVAFALTRTWVPDTAYTLTVPKDYVLKAEFGGKTFTFRDELKSEFKTDIFKFRGFSGTLCGVSPATIRPNSVIVMNFNAGTDLTTIDTTELLFRVNVAGGASVPYKLSYPPVPPTPPPPAGTVTVAPHQIIIRPDAPLTADTSYQIKLRKGSTMSTVTFVGGVKKDLTIARDSVLNVVVKAAPPAM